MPTGTFAYLRTISESHSEPSQTSTMKCYAKIVKSWKPVTIFAKHFILDV